MKAKQVAKDEQKLVLALIGNPNSGKTTIFNNLTGARQHVGNWPGVTVEKKEGELLWEGRTIQVVDLPGIYGFGVHSEDAAIARDYILLEKPDVVINIVDATNLVRNLYLTLQLLEMGANVVIALNMYDELRAKGADVDTARLSELLSTPVIPTVATRGQGMKEIISQALEAAKAKGRSPLRIDYGREIEAEISDIERYLSSCPKLAEKFVPRWLAIRILEGDEDLLRVIGGFCDLDEIKTRREAALNRLESIFGEEIESLIANRRYGFIESVAKEVIRRYQATEDQASISDKIDRIVTNRYLGIPIFLLTMWMVFQFTFKLGDPLTGLIEGLFERLGELMGAWLEGLGAPKLLSSLLVDGVINGVGSVLVFVPNIFLLFLAISILEDSGYMARAAYIMDRFMHAFGLHGKSFIPLLLGFGCNVPAIMATRTLESKRDRLITILIIPLMSCSARLPIYVLFASAFFSSHQGLVTFSLYLLGIILAILMGVIFKSFLFKGESSHFLMELPPYRMPTLKSTFIHMWERGSHFIRKAGTIIFMVTVLVWVLANLPIGVEYASQESALGRIGSFIAPIFKPAGFSSWEAAVALLFGILAKEVVVSTLGVVYGVEESGLREAISQNWTPLSAYAFMVMSLIYIPCIATIAVIKGETNSWVWAALAVSYSLILGWLVAVIVYQGGLMLGLG